MTETPPPPPPTLHRTLGPVGVMLLTFSALSPVVSVYIYGAGILHMAGTGAATAFLIGGVMSAVLALMYAELGAAFPQAGGIYPSLVAILGPTPSFPYIAMMMVMAPVSLAFSVLGFADYVRVLAPTLPQIPVAIACLVLAAALATLRIHTGAVITGVFLAVEAVALLILSAIALLHPVRSFASVVAHPVFAAQGAIVPLPPALLALAVVSALFASAGCNWAMYFGEEMKDAERRIGPVIAWAGPLAALTICGPLILVVLATKDIGSVFGSDAPVATFLDRTGGHGISVMISIGVLIAVFNAIVATVLGYSRFFYATGRDGIWPRSIGRRLAHIHPGSRSPVTATILLSICAAAAMLVGERALLILSSSSYCLELPLMALALLIGRHRGQTGQHYRALWHPLVPIFALVATVGSVTADWMDADAGRPSLFVLAIIIAGSLAYDGQRRRRTRLAAAAA